MSSNSKFYREVIVPFSILIFVIFICSEVIAIPVWLIQEHEKKQDQVIANNCRLVTIGDVVYIDDTPVYIGTAYLTGLRTVGGKGLKQEYQYSVSSLFVNQIPVLDFHGYRLITNSREVQYVCSPEAIEEIY